MKRVETKISETSIRLRYADNADPMKASEWMDFQFSIADLHRPNTGGTALGHLENRFLEELIGAVLLHAKDAIDAEIRNLRDIRGR